MNKKLAQAISLVGSQTKLAEAVGVTQPCVCYWLHGGRKIKYEYVLAICKATNNEIKPEDLRPDLFDKKAA